MAYKDNLEDDANTASLLGVGLLSTSIICVVCVLFLLVIIIAAWW